MDRLGTTFEVKSVSQRIISGHAAAWALDRVGDVIDRAAFRKTLSEKRPSDVAVFIGHKADELPVGVPIRIEPDEHGLFTEVRVFDGPAGDNLLAVAKGLKAAGQTLGLSIGYRVRDARMERREGKSIRVLTDIDLIEFSYAARQTVANPAALMTDVKQRAEGWDGKPYSVRKRGNKYVVVNSETGEVRGEHDTESDADRQVRALYANVPEARGKGGQMPTEDGKILPNTLPDSAFLYVQPGGQLDDEGKTVPRTLRHFRIRDAAGALDPTALASSLAAIPEAKGIGLNDADLLRMGARIRRTVDALAHGEPNAGEFTEWKTGASVDLMTVAYRLLDVTERIAAEHKALGVIGEGTKNGWRMRPVLADEIKAASEELARIAGHIALVAEGKDEEALADWWRAQFSLLEAGT